MDDQERGFYTLMKRKSMFPSVVYLDDGGDNVYDIQFAGTVPDEMRFQLRADTGEYQGIVVNIQYARPGSFSVYKEGVADPLDPLGFLPGGGGAILKADVAPVTGDSGQCGENNYEGGGVNRLSFFLKPEADADGTAGCVLTIRPRDAILLGVRLEMTLDQFFQEGGVLVFVHSMASLLGIHYADVRVTTAYTGSGRRQLDEGVGSLVVEFEVWSGEYPARDQKEEQKSFGEEVEAKFISLMSGLTEFMNTPVLNAVADGVPVETPASVEAAAAGRDDGFA